MLEVILHCANGPKCLSLMLDRATNNWVSNYIQFKQSWHGCYPEKEAVLAHATAMNWQLIQQGGKDVYVCVDCAEGEVCYEYSKV